MRPTPNPRVPQLLVEQLVAGELPSAQAADVRRRLEAEPDGLERLADVVSSNADILEALPPNLVAREVRARAAELDVAEHQATFRPRWAAWAAVAAVVVAAIVGVPRPDAPDGVRIKGLEPDLPIYLRHGEEVRALDPGASVSAGDLVQVAYVAPGKAHGVILSVDGRGVVTLHHPPRPNQSTALGTGGEQLLAHAYELDDAPRHETFVFVWDDTELAPADLVRQAEVKGPQGPFVDASGAELASAIVPLVKER